jgi:sensor domain CHASE-containing protein
MKERLSVALRRQLLIYAGLPLAYVASGRLGLLLAVPPGYATALFVPAGIAVGAMFIARASTLPGTFIGSLLLNLWIGYLISSQLGVTVAVVIAVGSTLQAAIGGALLRRTIGYPAALDNPRDLLLLLALSPLACLTSASLSLSAMWVLGAIPSADLLINWMTWWVGDTLGVLVILPLLLALVGEPRPLWRSRLVSVAVPMLLCLGLFASIFVRVKSWENDQFLFEFRMRSQQLADTIRATLEEQRGFLEQLSDAFVSRHQPVNRREFHDLVQTLLQRFPIIQAVEWAPAVSSVDRQRFESVQQAGMPGFEIRQRAQSGELQLAGERTQYYPVAYIEPPAGNELAIGFDLASDDKRRDAVEAAVASGHLVATAPIRLVQEHGLQSAILLIDSVSGGPTGPGIVLVVLRMGTFAERLVEPFKSMFNLRFADAAGAAPFFDQIGNSAAAPFETEFNFGGRQYLVATSPSAHYLAAHHGWESLGCACGGCTWNRLDRRSAAAGNRARLSL